MVWDTYRSDLFTDYIGRYIKIKNESSDKPVKRAIAKLLLNTLYGKIQQKPFAESTLFTNSQDELNEFLMHHEFQTSLNEKANKFIIKGKKLESDILASAMKPLHLASFVLGYSRAIMTKIRKEIDPTLTNHIEYYTDTDSLFMEERHAKILNDKGYIKGGLGYLSNDIKKDALIYEGHFTAPKTYGNKYINNEGIDSGEERI